MRDGIPLGEEHTVFGVGAMVGVAITFLVKTKKLSPPKIYYTNVDFSANHTEKCELIDSSESIKNIEWDEITTDKSFTWM